jgi:hypothetical protein
MKTDRLPMAEEYRAPLLAKAARSPQTVCAECPASLWYGAGDLFAFCTVMKMTMWPQPAGPVTRCDGRRAAVAKLAADMRRSASSG